MSIWPLYHLLRVTDIFSGVYSLKKVELKKTSEAIEDLKKSTSQNLVDIQKNAQASAESITNEEFSKLTRVVEANKKALRCLDEIGNNQNQAAPTLASTSTSAEETLAAL
ncbi:hypothetical protein L6452_36304 [Arctium lappa]|uniref:Uncharacterized protein n=1 Tax=Arctium lappa TaxID=4217 RepID=A0ACB8Y9I3_ARCLA|nr:hypothetical protein L6452_36304 [Arctium lappa]